MTICEFCGQPIERAAPRSVWWMTDNDDLVTRWCLEREKSLGVGYHRPKVPE